MNLSKHVKKSVLNMIRVRSFELIFYPFETYFKMFIITDYYELGISLQFQQVDYGVMNFIFWFLASY